MNTDEHGSGMGSWIVVVLAAGRGTRMGGPKALMRVRGREWWRVQEERLERAGVRRVWVVSEEVEKGMAGCGARLVRGDSGAPMFESVRRGVEAAEGRGIFVLPVDVPAPGRGVFEALAREGVCVPVFGGKRGHPVAMGRAWIETEFWPRVRQGGELRLDRMIEGARDVEVEDGSVVVNLNTAGDVEAWDAR